MLNIEKFPPGTRVSILRETLPLQVGRVVGEPKKVGAGLNLLIIEWDTGYIGTTQPTDQIILESQVEAETARIVANLTAFEQEFERVKDQINNHINDAASSVKAAYDLAKGGGKDLTDLYYEVQPLVNMLRELGWRTSSMSC